MTDKAPKAKDLKDKDAKPAEQAAPAPVVQLTRNQAGRQVGETFKREEAKKLGILDGCRPFPHHETR